MVVTCFHPDFAFRQAQTPKNMLGSLVKQLLTGLGELPGELLQNLWNQRVIGGRNL